MNRGLTVYTFGKVLYVLRDNVWLPFLYLLLEPYSHKSSMDNYGTQLYPLAKHWVGKAPYLKEFLEVLCSHVSRETNTLLVTRVYSAGEIETAVSWVGSEIAQSVLRPTMGFSPRGSLSWPERVYTGPWGPNILLFNGYRITFPR